jgi:hypothetical protein
MLNPTPEISHVQKAIAITEVRDRHAPGRAAVFFAYFLFGGLKRK